MSVWCEFIHTDSAFKIFSWRVIDAFLLLSHGQWWRHEGDKGDRLPPGGTLQEAAFQTQYFKNSRGTTYWLQEFRKLAFRCLDIVTEISKNWHSIEFDCYALVTITSSTVFALWHNWACLKTLSSQVTERCSLQYSLGVLCHARLWCIVLKRDVKLQLTNFCVVWSLIYTTINFTRLSVSEW